MKNGILVGQSFDPGSLLSIYIYGTTPAPLLPFQAEGVRWLLDNKRALLADDMGLGKTIQAISATRDCFARGVVTRALVVCLAL